MEPFQLYKDIQARTDGEIYIGVVGPVRTGKSTFIKRFMDLMVLPNMKDEHALERTRDELPQSASGTAIMTTEPKFVPKDAALIRLFDDAEVKIRLVDCVGYMVEGASGHIENEKERKVKTPWFDYEVPFTKAAAIGTEKVIKDHATIGIVVTTDGSICEIPRENYVPAEEKAINELKSIGKPFIVLLNTKNPCSEKISRLQNTMREKYHVAILPVNCEQLKAEDINTVMEDILYEFPITEVEFYIPKWAEVLSEGHRVKAGLISCAKKILDGMINLRSAAKGVFKADSDFIEKIFVDKIETDTGRVKFVIELEDKYYYEVLSELSGAQIKGEYELIAAMKELSAAKGEYIRIKDAFFDVKTKGYGVVSPDKDEIAIEDPVIIKQGNKYGVKIHSEAPTIHMIRANIKTDIAPVVGTEKQAQDLVDYLKAQSESEGGIWGTNIFGKSIEELVRDGIRGKLMMINDESRQKLQDTMQKIVNETTGGIVCIII